MPAGSRRTPTGLDLNILIRTLIQQRWVIGGVAAVSLAVALTGTSMMTPKYEATALIMLMPRAGQEVDVEEVVQFDEVGYMEGREKARTQIQVILSRSIREAVLDKYRDLGYGEEFAPGQAGTDKLLRLMSVSPREDTQLVEIRIAHTDAQRAAILANLTAEIYKASNLDARTSAAKETRGWLEGQTADYKDDLAAATSSLLDFKAKHNVVDIDESVDDISRRMSALQVALGDATTDLALLESELEEHRRLMHRGQYDVLIEAFDSPALQEMARRRAEAIAASADVFARYGEKHFEHKRTKAHLENMDALIAKEVTRVVDGERSRVRVLEGQVERLNTELGGVKEELLAKQRLRDEYLTLKMEEERLRRLYDSLGERGAEVELQARTQLGNVRIIDEAVAPLEPASPSLPLNLAVAMFVGLGGGLGLGLLRERLDDRLRTPEDVELVVDVPLLGAVPRLPAEVTASERMLYPFNHPDSPSAEALREIRSLLHAAVASTKNPKTLVVATHQRLIVTNACTDTEGRAFVALGLATAFTRLGVSTLLVDTEFRAPVIPEALGVDFGPGLLEALDTGRDPLEYVYRTGVPSLYLMAAGLGEETKVGAPEGRADRIASPEMAGMLERLSQRYPVVIVDAGLAEAMALSAKAEVIVVARSGHARESEAVRAVERLRQAGASVRGVVLNGTSEAVAAGARSAGSAPLVERVSALAGR